jgi:hypothetical protein
MKNYWLDKDELVLDISISIEDIKYTEYVAIVIFKISDCKIGIPVAISGLNNPIVQERATQNAINWYKENHGKV